VRDPVARALSGASLVLVVLAFTPVGSAVHNAVIPSNASVGAAQLKNGAVIRTKLGKNAVASPQVANGSLVAADFKAGQLPAGPAGPTGPAGPAGATGAAGAAGNNSLVGFANITAAGAVRSFGGQGTTGVTVAKIGTGTYDVTFAGTFPAGTTSRDRLSTFATVDTGNFDVASTSLDTSPAPTPTQITIRVFTMSFAGAGVVVDRDFAVQVNVPLT
jgi:hypothetical protein